MKEVESELYIFHQGNFSKLYSSEEVIDILEKRIKIANELLMQLHHLFSDENIIHKRIEEIQKVLKGDEQK